MKDKLIRFIQDELTDKANGIDEHTSLFKNGMLSSLDLIGLLDYVEKEFQLSIPHEDVNFENFNTVSSLVNYLQKKKNGA